MSTTHLSVIPNCDLLSFADSMTATELPMRYSKFNWEVMEANAVNTGYASGFTFSRKADSSLVYWPAALLSVPYVMAGTKRSILDGGTSTLGNPYFVGFKAPGSLSIVDRVTLNLGGANVSNNSEGLSRYMWLKFLMTVNENWFHQNGPALFMGSELPEKEVLAMRTNQWDLTLPAVFDCSANLTITPANTTADGVVPPDGAVTKYGNVYNTNRSFMSRCVNISRPGCRNMALPSQSANLTRATQSRGPFILPTEASSANYANGSVYLSGYAIIPLVWVHDIFRELKLAQNVTFLMNVQMNSCYNVLPADGGESMDVGSNANFPNTWQSCPIMVSTAGASAITATANNLGIQSKGNVGAIGVTFGSHSTTVGQGLLSMDATTQRLESNAVTPVELWYPVVEPTPEQANEILSNPPKSLIFSDFYNGNSMIAPVVAGAQFNHLVGEFTSAKRLIMTLQTPSTLTKGSIPVRQQCISSEGYFSTPHTSLRSLQCKINGQQIYIQPLDYEYLHYVNSFKDNLGGAACNSNISYSQGIYSKAAWDVSPIYVINLDRYVKQGTSPSIVISGVNSSSIPIEIVTYVETLSQLEVAVTPSQFKILSAVESL